MGLRVVRYKTVLIDAVLVTDWSATRCSQQLREQSGELPRPGDLVDCPLTAIYLVDMYLRRYHYTSDDLLRPQRRYLLVLQRSQLVRRRSARSGGWRLRAL